MDLAEIIRFTLLPYGTLIALILVGVFLLSLATPYKKKTLALVTTYALPISFFASLLAMLGSLFYSEILGWNPCVLCWYQRIAMYPLVVIFGVAWYYEDKKVYIYGLWLSAIGALIALYHWVLQVTGMFAGDQILPCGSEGECVVIATMSFGFITIPMMAFAAFTVIFVSMLVLRRSVLYKR